MVRTQTSRRLRAVAIILALSVPIAAALFVRNAWIEHDQVESRSSGHPGEPVAHSEQVSITAYPINLSPEEAAAASDVVVRGMVRSLSAARWNTPDGKRPVEFDPAGVPGKYMVYRTALVEITANLVESKLPTPSTVEVTVFGGEVDGVVVSVSDWGPNLSVGDDVILFLNEPSEEQLIREYWTALQYFTLDAKGEARNEFQFIPLSELTARVRSSAQP